MAVVLDSNSLIFCLIVLLRLHVIQGINQYGIGVCSGNNNGTKDWYYYCCFNFYLRNGKCTECENGTVSQDGISCTNCSGNTYGHQCKFRCSCLPAQRCDHRLGCVNNDSYMKSTEAGAKVTVNEEIIDNETSSTTFQSANYKTISTITKYSIPADSKTTYFYYILTTVVWVVFTVLCVSCIIFIHKRRHRRTQNFPTETVRARVGLPFPPISRTSDHIYHTIDDIVISNIQQMSTHNEDGGLVCELMRIASRVSDDSTNSSPYDEFDEEDYLNPYTTLKERSKRETVLHEYDECRIVCSQREDRERIMTEQDTTPSVIFYRKNDEYDYPHSYTSLKDKSKTETVIHEYEAINKLFQPSNNLFGDNEKGRRFSIPLSNAFGHFIIVKNTIHSAHNDKSLKFPLHGKYPTF